VQRLNVACEHTSIFFVYIDIFLINKSMLQYFLMTFGTKCYKAYVLQSVSKLISCIAHEKFFIHISPLHQCSSSSSIVHIDEWIEKMST
jgi:hypothetical protein